MNTLEEQLLSRGLSEEDVTFVVDLVEERTAEEARGQAAQLLRLIFLRVERDSPAGCALRRALGFSSDASLARAARDFCVSKQYVHDLQMEIEESLGSLSFIAKATRESAAAHDPAPGQAGPLAEEDPHR